MVASISACKDPFYYLLVQFALYYLTGDAGAGVWYGEAAKFLGFAGTVLREQLVAAFNGLGSDGYTRHVQLPKGRNRQPAWDVTFSAPKSVSVLWSLLGAYDRHKIESLLMQAAKRAVDYLDSKALLTRRGKGGETVEHAKGVYALCPHGTSRSQDPQLHVHALVMNMCVREKDGTTGTIRSKDLYLHKMAAGALFRVELASLLATQLGLKIDADGWSFKIAGVPQSLCDEQSKRRQVIEQLAKEFGWNDPRLLAQLAVRTRAAKGLVSMAECTKEWLEAGERHSFGRHEAERLLDAGQEALTAGLATRLRADARDNLLRDAIRKSIASLSNSQAYFAERDLIQHVAASVQASGLTADEIVDAVEDAVDSLEHRIELRGSHYRYYATTETLAAERELLSIAELSRGKTTHAVSNEVLSKAKQAVEQRLSKGIGIPTEFTFDQTASLIHVTQEPGGVKLVQGYAGTGKTQMLEAANLAWERDYDVIGTAVSGKAAAGLQTATGIRSVTISKLMRLLRPDLTRDELANNFSPNDANARQAAYHDGFRTRAWMKNPLGEALKEMERDYQHRQTAPPSYKLTDKSILVVDEAGMVPTKMMLWLLQECEKAGTKLVLVGDALQLPAIEAGGSFTSLCERLGCQYLTTVVRQRQPWMREATYALIENEPRQALDLYAAHDSLRIEKSHNAAAKRLIADYGKLPAADYVTSLALTSTRAEAARINAGVQQRRLAAGQLGATSALLSNGERVYENDRIMLTRNDYPLGSRNGMHGTVVSILVPPWRDGPARLEVKLDNPVVQKGYRHKTGVVVIDLEKYTNVQIGYAVTAHKAQGATVKSSYVLLGDSMLNKEMAFTQLTRASHSTTIYTGEAELGSTLEHLTSRLSRSSAKDLANDHRIVAQSQSIIEKRQALLHDTLSRLGPAKPKEAVAPTAYLSDARFGASQTGAMWLLIGHYNKLTNADYEKTIAVVTDTFEVGRINNSVQYHRQAARQLGVDSLEIRQGERVHRGDRVLVTINNEQGVPRTLLGTAVGLGFPNRAVMKPGRGQVVASQTQPWLTIELDSQHQAGQSAEAKERLTVEGRDFDKLQLGYAATADRLKDIKVDSSLVLLPERGRLPQDIAIQLTRATRDVAVFGEQSHYGPILDAGGGKGSFAKSLDALQRDGLDADSTSLADRYRQKLEEQQRLQRVQNEQFQLSRQQSFEL